MGHLVLAVQPGLVDEIEPHVLGDHATDGIEIPSNAGFETVAGFLLMKLGYIPKAGESVEEGGRRYTVLEMDRNRIAKVRVEKLEDVGQADSLP